MTFHLPASNAYGSNQKNVDTSPVRYAIYSRDVNQEGSVDLSDIDLVYNDANSFVSGYVSTDVNGDSITDLSDLLIAHTNSSSFVTKVVPGGIFTRDARR